jgi:Abnormal spindle-like microcephaly-assoc'd, ASPM-SPD-2-Hydin
VKTPLFRLAPVLFWAMLFSGCAGTVASNSTGSGSGSGGGSGSNPQGQLGVSPSTLSFGSIAVGNSKSLTATLTAANADVQVSSADWNGQGYSVSGISFPLTIAAGKSASFTVTFTPTAAGSTPGSIAFASDATDPNLVETLSGTGTSTGGTTQHSVTLSWSPSSSSVAGYNIYRGTASGGPYTKLNPSLETATVYTDATVKSSTTYYYVATSVDSSMDESAYSNQTVAQIPQ